MFEWLSNLSPGVLALIGTIIGSIGLKLLENYLGRERNKVSDATQIRSELRAQIDACNRERELAEAEADKWRGLYYDLRDDNINLRVELKLLQAQKEPVPQRDTGPS